MLKIVLFVFKKLYELYVDMKRKNIDNVTMNVLSMGMTGDYQTAIEEGATMVRVGTGIFGTRAKIGEKYFALGIGKEEIHVIAELKKDDLKLPDQMVDATVEKTPKMSFKEVLANMKGNAKDDNEK